MARWLDAVCRRSWSLKKASSAKQQCGEEPEVLTALGERCSHFLESLQQALELGARLDPGAPELRETIQSLSFTAGWMAGVGLQITDAVSMVHGLEEVLGWNCGEFFESLVVVASEAYAASLAQREQARYREAMEKSQLVCDPHPRLPCLFLVGDPDRRAVDEALGRVMMLAVMREAPAVLVDGSGLLFPEQVLPSVYNMLCEHAKATVAASRVVLSGVPPVVAQQLQAQQGCAVLVCEMLPDAVREAVVAGGLTWVSG